MKEKLKLFISKHRILARFCAQLLYLGLKLGWKKRVMQKLQKNVELFVQDPKKRANNCYMRKLKKDILYCRLRYFTDFEEYFFYRFEKLNELGRSEYVGRHQQNLLWNKFDKEGSPQIFRNKENTYQLFKPYFGRELIKVISEEDRPVYDSFVGRHNKFIVKPIALGRGRGVHIVELQDNEDSDKVFSSLIAMEGGTVLEEVIIQASEMAKFHPESVNTIRFVTFFYKNKLTKILAALRMGRGANLVDNAAAGGIFATVDIETGIVCDYGRSETGETFLKHPDTGVQILGAQIPKWEELQKLLEELVKVAPQQKYAGWDLALTNNGWIIVEGNTRPVMQIFSPQYGLKERAKCMFDAYNE